MPQPQEAPTALDLGRAIAAGTIDPRDVVRQALAAADASERGMIVHSLTERSFAEADAAFGRAKSGTRRSALDGVPISWKDNIEVVGAPCEAGSRLLEGRRPAADAPVVSRAARGGLVSFAKTGMTELAYSGLGLNPWSGTPRNAFDEATPRLPGGSSAGAAVSVARRVAPLAVGTDTGGSVRIPAAWNNLIGLKTTWGRLPLGGVVPLSPSYDTLGSLARSVADVTALYEILADERPIDLAAGAAPRLFVAAGPVLAAVEPEVMVAFEAALGRLRKAGVQLDEQSLPALAEAAKTPAAIAAEVYAIWGAQVEARPDLVFARVAERVLGGRDLPAHVAAERTFRIEALRRQFLAELAGFDGVLLPTVAIRPPPIAQVEASAQAYASANNGALVLPSMANRLGLCAITLPAGFTFPPPLAGEGDHEVVEGAPAAPRAPSPAAPDLPRERGRRPPPLPFGLSIFAPPFAERRLLQIAAHLEAALAGSP
jgi:aspartyl-tRNA(Asn)/glutamyl-tRNA(Gln) amidotransferase subunit A